MKYVGYDITRNFLIYAGRVVLLRQFPSVTVVELNAAALNFEVAV